MPAQEIYAQAASIALAALTLLHGLVWRLQRQRWSLLLALAFGLGALNYGLDSHMAPSVARATLIGGLTTATGLVLMTLGLVEYVGLPARAHRIAMGLVVGVALLVLALRLAGLVPRIVASATFALYFLLQAGLMLWAMRREPRSGHGLVLAALLLYPAVFAAVLAGAFDGAMLRYLVIVPTAVTGGAVLTTGLLRAQRRAEAELAGRQRAEEELRRLNDTLEQRVAQRTRELHEVVAGLESFNRSVSHDLRGPLGGMAGVARLAREAVARGDLLTVQRLLSAIEAQADSSSQLVAALLALARVGEVRLAPEPIELDAFVRDTLAQMDLADPAGAEVPVRLQPLPAVEADPALLRQVLVNLLGNARKFSRQAGLPQVEVSGETGADGLPVIHVRDNGVGFDPGQAEAMFEPFRRLHAGQFSGHGVGLSIVKRIVERHGGRVWASANPGGGAVFSFTLGRPRTLH